MDDAKALDFPSILYGRSQSVRGKCQRRFDRARRAGKNAAEVFEGLDFVDVSGSEEPFYVGEGAFIRLPSNENAWRMYLVSEKAFHACVRQEEKTIAERIEEYDRLMWQGMRAFWFTLGCLDHNGDIFYLHFDRQNYSLSDVVKNYLSRYAY